MKEHFFISSCDGALHDTRDSDWSEKPLRSNYAGHKRNIESVADMKATLRAGAYCWPGGYELFFSTNDGGAICFDCARKEFNLICDSIRHGHNDGWRVVACEIAEYYEDGLACDHCNREIVPFDESEE
jgi:hypothetical protein